MERIIWGDKVKMPMTECFYTMNGQMMAYDSGGVTKDFLTDHLGSITAEIDQTQARTYDTRYSAYGRNNWSTGTGCGFGWVGSYGYRETGLFHMSHYVRARHYSYVTGGWSTVDPLWPDESAYGYVRGRSCIVPDPSGLLGIDINDRPGDHIDTCVRVPFPSIPMIIFGIRVNLSVSVKFCPVNYDTRCCPPGTASRCGTLSVTMGCSIPINVFGIGDIPRFDRWQLDAIMSLVSGLSIGGLSVLPPKKGCPQLFLRATVEDEFCN
jgi:RHS repeat-associated protein